MKLIKSTQIQEDSLLQTKTDEQFYIDLFTSHNMLSEFCKKHLPATFLLLLHYFLLFEFLSTVLQPLLFSLTV